MSKKRFVILLDDEATAEQHTAFLKYLGDESFGYWHWFPHSWLLTKKNATSVTAESLRNTLKEYYGKTHTLVLELNGDGNDDTWAGLGPKSDAPDGKNMFTWLKANW